MYRPKRSYIILLGVLAVILGMAVPVLADGPSLAEHLRAISSAAHEGVEAAEAGDIETLRHEYDEIHEAWEGFEDEIRSADPMAYVELEGALAAVKEAVQAEPVDTTAAKQAYEYLQVEADEFAEKFAAGTSTDSGSNLAANLRAVAHAAHEGVEAAEAGDIETLRHEYDEIHEAWEGFEDSIRAQSPTAYVELEGALDAVKEALKADPPDLAVAGQAFAHLQAEAEEFAEAFEAGTAPAGEAVEATPADLLKNLDTAYQAVESGDTATAAEQVQAVIMAWPSVEGAIAVKDPDAYTAIEVDLSKAAGALKSGDMAGAEAAIERLRENLAPFAAGTRYTAFDAAAIILREGLEALLVIVALLAFLNRSGNADKRGWIWGGALMGVLASLVTAFILQRIFSAAIAGQNRELIEGITGLVAAALLFYVSYWLHSKSNLKAWQKFIDQRTSQALARGSMLGLAALSFLAVFREGAETTIFYLGMAPSITLTDLTTGLGVGFGILVVVAVLMLKVGLRLPLRPFFQVAGLLVYYLGFKFVGSGIHALQVAGVLPATPADFLQAVPFIGLYPTWEVFIPQLLLLVAAVAVVMYLRSQHNRAAVPVR
ncbi:MAG: iron permease [Chloroflexi bacterium]|nr:MAG: iron permease [Chloroflexota bacterium]